MSSRRTLILIGAVVIGGLAAFLTLNYVRGVESENAEQNQLVEVLVAAGPIPKGASADEALTTELIGVDDRRRADLPAAVVRRPAEIAGLVAAVNLTGGEIITTSMFIPDTEISGSKGTSLDKGNVAVTINVEESAGVAGLIQPGDSVNILAGVTDLEGPVDESTDLQRGPDGYRLPGAVVVAFQDVKVLGVGQSLGEPVAAEEGVPAEPAVAGSGLITVQLPPAQAVRLVGMLGARLYLTLNRPDFEPVPIPFEGVVPDLPGEQGVSAYPQSAEETGQ